MSLNIEENNATEMSTHFKNELIRKNKVLIEAVRRCCSGDKSEIARAADVSWPTANNFLTSFTSKENNTDNLVIYSDDIYQVNPVFGVFLGISVGGQETKATLLDFSLNTLSFENMQKYRIDNIFSELSRLDRIITKNYTKQMICYETKNDLDYISHMCKSIIIKVLDVFSKTKKLKLLGIGITFPGIIGKKSLTISFCPNISCLNGANLLCLFQGELMKRLEEQNISLCIAHDTAAITVFEKERLYKRNEYKNKENIVCLYMGIGLGLGVIINNQLLTGNNNSIGEIGHIPGPSIDLLKPEKLNVAPHDLSELEKKYIADYKNFEKEKISLDSTEACYCRVDNCMERLIRTNVFDSSTKKELLTKISNENDLKNFHIVHPFRYQILKFYLQYLFTIIINLFNPDLIILCGKALNSLEILKDDKYVIKQSSGIDMPASNCDIINGSNQPECVASGAAMLAYYKLVESNGNNDEKGMQFDIKWSNLNI